MQVSYFPVLVFIAIALFLGFFALLIGWLAGPRRPYPAKSSSYECGFEAFNDARLPFNVRFYVVAILFIIFDVETAFLLPWAVVLRHIGGAGFWGMMVFLGILVLGFIYEWKRGALEWK